MKLGDLRSQDSGSSQDFIDLGDICLSPKYSMEYPSLHRIPNIFKKQLKLRDEKNRGMKLW